MKALILLAIVIALSACGGGGGEPTPQERQDLLLREQRWLAAQIDIVPPPSNVATLIAQFNANATAILSIGLPPACGTQKGREPAYLACRAEFVKLTTPR